MLHQIGYLCPDDGNGEQAREAGAESSRGRSGGQEGGGPLDVERRATLLRVLMICEANIFGEEDGRGDTSRLCVSEGSMEVGVTCPLASIVPMPSASLLWSLRTKLDKGRAARERV